MVSEIRAELAHLDDRIFIAVGLEWECAAVGPYFGTLRAPSLYYDRARSISCNSTALLKMFVTCARSFDRQGRKIVNAVECGCYKR